MGLAVLNPDTQIQILKRLPQETLLRMMSTSKSMLGIITSMTFMMTVNPTKTPYHMYSYGTPNGDLEFVFCEFLKDKTIRHYKKVSPVDSRASFIGSSYGILCFCTNLFNVKDQQLVFWNPFLGRVLTLPMHLMPADRYHALGFGFDRLNVDYKVVRIEIQLPLLPVLPTRPFCIIRADVFKLSSSAWDHVDASISNEEVRFIGECAVFLHGVMHCYIKKMETHGSNWKYAILTFNLATEMFGEIQLPETEGRDSMNLTSFTINDTEKLVAYYNDREHCNVWMMEEYGVNESWKEICTIKLGSKEYGTILNVLNGSNIVVSTNKGRLLRYDIETREQRHLKPLNNFTPTLEYVGPYVENLFFPTNDDRTYTKVPKVSTESMKVMQRKRRAAEMTL